MSQNQYKLDEAATILRGLGIAVVPLNVTICELQTQDSTRLVRDKTLKAFSEVGRPLFVEHTGLYLSHLPAHGIPCVAPRGNPALLLVRALALTPSRSRGARTARL